MWAPWFRMKVKQPRQSGLGALVPKVDVHRSIVYAWRQALAVTSPSATARDARTMTDKKLWPGERSKLSTYNKITQERDVSAGEITARKITVFAMGPASFVTPSFATVLLATTMKMLQRSQMTLKQRRLQNLKGRRLSSTNELDFASPKILNSAEIYLIPSPWNYCKFVVSVQINCHLSLSFWLFILISVLICKLASYLQVWGLLIAYHSVNRQKC